MFNMSTTVAVNDIKYYQQKTNQQSFFTGYNVYGIIWLQLGNTAEAAAVFNRTFLFMQSPFNVWKETLEGGHQNCMFFFFSVVPLFVCTVHSLFKLSHNWYVVWPIYVC